MRRSVGWGVALTLALACPSVGRAGILSKDTVPPAKPAGRLVVEKETVDVGQVVRGETTSGTFVLKNTGTEPIRILSAKPG